MEKIEALSKYLACETSDLVELGYEYYGLTVFSLGRSEYAIGTDEKAAEACKANIKDSLWAFNASFILRQCDLPIELEEALKITQEKQCESANDWLLKLIESTCGFDAFVSAAISADGRGHFLSQYDGEEHEQGEYFIYRLN